MRVIEDFTSEPVFELLEPAERAHPYVFSSPHSGSAYPREFLAATRLDGHRIRLSEDSFVDELFSRVVDLGAPLLRARFPRAYVDVNREPYELDPRLFAERLPPFANSRTVRVANGLGTIPRVISEQDEIYDGPIALDEALSRIETIYMPYHAALRRLLAETHDRFARAVLVDCHSMPSAIRGIEPRPRVDIVLGDRRGTSAEPALIERIFAILSDLGYRVAVNRPYAGGFITEHYGHPAQGLHAVQIEINRALYMDERRLVPTDGLERLRSDLAVFAKRLFALPWGEVCPAADRFAAE